MSIYVCARYVTDVTLSLRQYLGIWKAIAEFWRAWRDGWWRDLDLKGCWLFPYPHWIHSLPSCQQYRLQRSWNTHVTQIKQITDKWFIPVPQIGDYLVGDNAKEHKLDIKILYGEVIERRCSCLHQWSLNQNRNFFYNQTHWGNLQAVIKTYMNSEIIDWLFQLCRSHRIWMLIHSSSVVKYKTSKYSLSFRQ